MPKRIIIILLPLTLFISACVIQKSPVTGKKMAYAYSWQQEIELGRQVDEEITRLYSLYDDPMLTDYIIEVGEQVLNYSHLRRETTDRMFSETPFVFRVLDSPVVNAFALPGGYNYVTRGLLAHLNNEAQLAMVIGHEIAHVAARHASQQALKQQTSSIIIIGTAVLGEELLGIPAEQVLGLGNSAAQLIFLSYSRDAERESDRLGVEYSAMAGYKADEGSAFFTSLRRITEASGSHIPSHLSSHPDPGEREADIAHRASIWYERGFNEQTVQQERYLRSIEGMIYGENPRHGFVQDGIFYHPDLQFQFPIPEKWSVINEASRVIILHESDKAVNVFTIDNESETVIASVDRFGNQEGVTVIDRNVSLSINGNTAARLTAEITDKNDQILRLHITAIQYNNTLYRFISYASKEDFDTYYPSGYFFSEGFEALTNDRILNIEPVRLEIITTQEEHIFKDILPGQLPFQITPEELAIINQVELNQPIPKGTKLKIPVTGSSN